MPIGLHRLQKCFNSFQAITRNAKHDGKKEILEKKMQELEEKQRQELEQQRYFCSNLFLRK